MYNVGKCLSLSKQGRYEDAENYADKSLMLDPNDFVGWGVKGIMPKLKAIKR